MDQLLKEFEDNIYDLQIELNKLDKMVQGEKYTIATKNEIDEKLVSYIIKISMLNNNQLFDKYKTKIEDLLTFCKEIKLKNYRKPIKETI
jgi:hypothetical protein